MDPNTEITNTTESKPNIGGSDLQQQQLIILRVMSQTGSETHFKLKNNVPLRKVIASYCQRNSLEPKTVRFLFDGKRVDETKTPMDLGMEDNDIIDVVAQQTGGSAIVW